MRFSQGIHFFGIFPYINVIYVIYECLDKSNEAIHILSFAIYK